MESLRTNQVKPMDRRAALAGMALAAFAPLGCFGIGKNIISKDQPKAAVSQGQGLLRAAWENKVHFAPDTSRGGAIIPGLTARVWLFDPQYATRLADGELKIDLYDSTPRGGDSEPKLLELYIMPPEVLQLFARTDLVGEGYSIFFPWFRYQPDIKNVYLVMRLTTSAGEVFMHHSGTISVDHTEALERAKKGMAVTASTTKQVSLK